MPELEAELTLPVDLPSYSDWLIRDRKCDQMEISPTRYDLVVAHIMTLVEAGTVWQGVLRDRISWGNDYYVAKNFFLYPTLDPPKLCSKPYESFMLKGLRRNILENPDRPSEPKDGWILPNNWWSTINDIVRTRIVVKYLDGVRFVAEKVHALCQDCGAACAIDMKQSEYGYYAAHVYFCQPVTVPRLSWDVEETQLSVEIQVTTQLQEVIDQLTRKYYERRRQRTVPPSIEWQWDHESDEFVPNYLGHILHYVEGMIMEVRARNGDKSA